MNFLKQRRLNRLERNVIQAAKVWSGSFKYHSDAEAAERVLLKAVKKLVKYEEERRMSFHVGDKVRVDKDITRAQGPYAQEGEEGEIVEIIYGGWRDVYGTGKSEVKPVSAKVRVIRERSTLILTFRLTSLRRAYRIF